MRTFDEDLKRELEDPEFAAGFYNEQQESLKELLKCGVVSEGNTTSLNSRTQRYTWELIVDHLKSLTPEKVREELRKFLKPECAGVGHHGYPCPIPDWGACRKCKEDIDQILQIVNAQRVIEVEEVKKILHHEWGSAKGLPKGWRSRTLKG